MDEKLIWETLKLIQDHDPTAVIAGGYPRDIALGRKPRDVDIFMHSKIVAPSTLMQGFRTLGFQGHEKSLYGGHNWPLLKMQRHSKGQNTQFDVVFFPEPIDENCANLFRTFDFGLCMIAQRERDKHIVAPEFVADRMREKLTLYVEDRMSIERLGFSVNVHSQALHDKYPTWKMEVKCRPALSCTKDQAN